MKIWSYNFSTRIDGKGELVERANKYFEALEVQGFSPLTIQTYAFVLISFFRWIKSDWQKFFGFNQRDLLDWLIFTRSKELKPNSINQRMCCARSFYRFCFDKEIPHVPGVVYPKGYYRSIRRTHLGLFTVKPKRQRELSAKVPRLLLEPITAKEVDNFLLGIKRYRDLGVILSMLLCGLRRNEVISLQLSDINFHQSILKVKGKGKKERFVPMPFHLMQVFEKYLNVERPKTITNNFFVILQGKKTGQPLTTSGVREFFRKRRLRLGIPKAKPHQFRHAFASDMARAGVPLTTIQKLLGHADPKTSLIYIDLVVDDIKTHYFEAMKKIEERYVSFQSKKTSRTS